MAVQSGGRAAAGDRLNRRIAKQMICPCCGKDTAFAVYDGIDQAMCMNCEAVLFDFSLIEEAREINRRKDGDGDV